jgi:DNA modification methylase
MFDGKFIDQLLRCDCLEGMPRLPDSSIPLTLTSPPYDALREYGGHRFDFEKFQAVGRPADDDLPAD